MSDIQATTYDDAIAVTQSDTVNDPAGPFAGLWVQAAGVIKLTTTRGNTVIVSAAAGLPVTIACVRVWTSVTTATGITGLYSLPYKQRGTV